MKIRSALAAVSSLTAVFAPRLLMAVPTEIARESFDGAGGAIGFTTSVAQFDEPTVATSDFFSVQPNNGTKLSGGTLAGGDGANMFAAEDIDTNPGPLVGPTQSITFSPVNISGKTSTSVKVLLAAPGTGPAGGGTQNFYDWSATAADIDFIRVEASVDGGPFNRLAQFSPTTNLLNQPLSLDTDGNGLGGQGTTLTAAFQEFDFPFSTGASVQIRVVMHSNATSEYLCLDNVRIFGESPATAPPVLGGVPGTSLIFNEGGAAAALAPAITVTDSDSANLTSATVTITANLTSGEDVLAATPSGAILAGDIVYTPGTGTLTITRNAPLATWQTVLRSVTYQNTNVAGPNTATRNVTFSASDGVNASNSPIRQVDVVDTILTHNLPFTESFETDGRGTRYALDGRFTNGAAMFDRGAPSGTSNLDGTFAIIAEDTILDAAPVKAVRFLLNTAPVGTVKASVRLGALGGAIYDTGDIIAIEASVNGGAFTTVAAFRSMGGVGFPMALDTDNNGIGDGTQLSATMQDFSFAMPAATTLGLRVRCQSNSAGERLIVDRIVVTGTPTVTPNTANRAINAPTIVIAGTGFNAGTPGANTVVFNNSATGNVTAATATSLTVTFTAQPAAAGSLTAVVTSFGGSSGAAVQVATIVAAPAVTLNTANLAMSAPTVTIGGSGFNAGTPGANTVVFNNSATGNVTASTATSLTVTFTAHPAAAGSLTAIVTSFGGSSGAPVQVATILAATPVESWRKANFGSPANSGNGADGANPDGDADLNRLEFAFGTNPNVAQSNNISYVGNVITPGAPTVQITNLAFGVDFRVLFGRRKDFVAAGLGYSVEFSADFTTWVAPGIVPTVVADNGVIEAVTVPYPLVVSGGKKPQFFRIVVTGP